jgi:hypothetical protein
MFAGGSRPAATLLDSVITLKKQVKSNLQIAWLLEGNEPNYLHPLMKSMQPVEKNY